MTTVIRIADCPEVPWKNGGGATREIAVFPQGAGMDDFLWRLSMARVDATGAFSSFDGVDRVLAVLEGRLQLTAPAIDARLDDRSPPFAFDGAAPITGEPLDGAVLDLNAMARRGRYRIEMRRLAAGAILDAGEADFALALEAQRFGNILLDRFDCARVDATTLLKGSVLLVRFLTESCHSSN